MLRPRPIPDLCRRANQPDSCTIYLHGSLFSVKCSSDNCMYTRRDQEDPIVSALALPTAYSISDPSQPLPEISRESLPLCPRCSSLLRPAVTWFGESVPPGTIEHIR